MGLKLELLLAVLIVLTSVVTMSVKLREPKTVEKSVQKEIEFTNTMFSEVTTKGVESIAFATYGVRINAEMFADNLVYHSKTIELLRARKGRYTSERIYLDGNVSLEQKEGFNYRTQHAYYDKPTAILYATSPFVATKGKSVIRGKRMAYRTRSKEIFATKVNAVVYTAEK